MKAIRRLPSREAAAINKIKRDPRLATA